MSVLEISDLACHLSSYRGFLKLSVNGKEIRKIAFDNISAIITKAHGITFSQNLLVKLANHNIPLVISDQSFMPISCLTPISAHHQSSLITSLQASCGNTLNNQLWKKIVSRKLKHQVAVLKLKDKDSQKISALIARITSGDRHNIEAQAAKIYWRQILGDRFRRKRFGKTPNDLLNYGYIILRSALARHVVAAGLHPSLGIHHRHQRNSFCLVDDLIEPYRTITDLTVLHCIESNKTELNKETKSILVQQLQQPIRHKTKWISIENSMKKTAQSLAISYREKKDKLQLPKPNYKKMKFNLKQ